LSNDPPAGTSTETPGQPKPATTAVVADLAALFYKHPLILGLGSGERKPSYIPAQYFSSVLEQVLKAGKSGQDYATLIGNLPDGPLKQKLSALADRVGNEAAAIRTEVEHWFDTTMDRVSGWYKRQAQKIVLAVAFVLVIALNADSFAVFRAL